jgi:hypothetical protein
MTQSVIHQPRVAWDAARTFVRAAGSTEYREFAGRVFQQLGIQVYGELGDTRERLLAAQADLPGDQHMINVETGTWRVRLQDLMLERPDLVGCLQDLSHWPR